MKAVIKTLRAAEAALLEGFQNCGEEPDCLYAEPLAQVRDEIRRLVGMAPEFDLVIRWCAGEINEVPTSAITAAAAKVRAL